MFQGPFLQSKTFVRNRLKGKIGVIVGSLWWAGERKLTWVRAVSWYPEGTAPKTRCHVGPPLSMGTSRPLPARSPAAQSRLLDSCRLGLPPGPQARQIILAPRQSVWQTTRAPLAKHKQRRTLVQEDGGLVTSLGKLQTQLGTGSIRGTAWRYLLRSHFHCWCLKVSGL